MWPACPRTAAGGGDDEIRKLAAAAVRIRLRGLPLADAVLRLERFAAAAGRDHVRIVHRETSAHQGVLAALSVIVTIGRSSLSTLPLAFILSAW